MKISQLIFICFFTSSLYAQSNTEIFLFDIGITNSKIEIKNGKDISNNEGYDNQPSFLDNRYIVFASTRNGQTDIEKYDTQNNTKVWISFTEGGEYSPLKIPNKNEVSAVRLDKDGKQRLYAYNINNGKSTELIKDLVVAYYTWYDENTIVSAVIEGDNLNLYVTNLRTGTNKKIATKVGRSFHKIPNSNLVSFISKKNKKQWQIKSLNPKTGATKLIANTIKGVEDICWLNAKNLLSSKKGALYKLTLQKDYNWKKVKDLSDDGILKITRIATNVNGTKLLITGDLPANSNLSKPMDPNQLIEAQASQIIDKHSDAFNKRELEEFVNTFNTNVTVNRFPDENLYSSRDKLKENYRLFFENNEKSDVKTLSRITLGTVVIDEELITVNNTTKRQVTIFETDVNGISSMTFIANSKTKKKQEKLINEQLETYNEKDVKAYGRAYSKNAMIYDFPHKITIDGRSEVREQYITLLENTPNLHAEIVNRIIIGNKVIDKVKTTMNDKTVYNIAIYEIENGLISSVTYIQ